MSQRSGGVHLLFGGKAWVEKQWAGERARQEKMGTWLSQSWRVSGTLLLPSAGPVGSVLLATRSVPTGLHVSPSLDAPLPAHEVVPLSYLLTPGPCGQRSVLLLPETLEQLFISSTFLSSYLSCLHLPICAMRVRSQLLILRSCMDSSARAISASHCAACPQRSGAGPAAS